MNAIADLPHLIYYLDAELPLVLMRLKQHVAMLVAAVDTAWSCLRLSNLNTLSSCDPIFLLEITGCSNDEINNKASIH